VRRLEWPLGSAGILPAFGCSSSESQRERDPAFANEAEGSGVLRASQLLPPAIVSRHERRSKRPEIGRDRKTV